MRKGDPVKMATVGIEHRLSPMQKMVQFSSNLTAMLPLLSGIADIISKETLMWKFKLLKSASAYANSRLHAVKAEVLVLASDKDNILPSQDEAQRLKNSLSNCIIRRFKDNGHTLLLEESLSLLTVIKGTSKYRHSTKHDFISDFLPPSMSEIRYAIDIVASVLAREEDYGLRTSTSRAVRRQIAKSLGALPVTANYLLKALSTKSHVLLYPGGIREALHYKKLFWPDQPEFVRKAARFGATIVPFGTVGEDDIVELVLDYNDWMKIPVINERIKEYIRGIKRARDETKGEVANQQLFIPGMLPKVPGRFYYLFGKPIKLKGREDLLKNREEANELYLQVKSEVEQCIDYLLKKREEDPYRSMIDRTLYSSADQAPAFKP